MQEELEVRVERLEKLVAILLNNQFPAGDNVVDIKKHFPGYLREDKGSFTND